MKQCLNIVYQDYIPEELIDDFMKLELDKQLDIIIIREKLTKQHYCFSGIEISDIILYFNQHYIELIFGGLTVNLAYDILKKGIKFLWKSVVKLPIKKIDSDGKISDKTQSICLRIKDSEKSVEITLNGEFNEEQADKIIDESFKLLVSDYSDKSTD
ncbi:MAG: hypothetical protein EPN82_07100 [Bacteroidetes bacterium]|nr:MAG: hypothetical protein EPN82_07100 [Bacteroidota bacterium]